LFFRSLHICSDFEEFPRSCRQNFGAARGHNGIIFDPDSPEAFDVHAGFQGDHVSILQAPLLTPGQPGILMDFQADPVPSAMDKVTTQPLLLQDTPCGGIHSACGHPGLHSVPSGKAPARVRRWYQAVLEAQIAARDAVKAGVTTGAVDAAARGVLQKKGLGRYFVHSTGHGIGLEIHEDPRLARGQKGRLENGNVITLEPGVYIEGLGGIRIEDDAVVTPRGAEILTTAPRELLEI